METHFDIPEFKILLNEIRELKIVVSNLEKKLLPPKFEKDKLINAKKVCEMLSISNRQLGILEVNRKIKPIQPTGGRRYYFQKDIENYIQSLRKT